MIDLDAYLERIGLRGRPSLAEVHLAHATSVPFENLDPHAGVPVALEPESLERKLVHERRGGYCFEQNLLLAEALRALGAEVELMLARVRYGASAGVVRPRGHLVLKVRSEGAVWQADVGFGFGTLLEPLPFGPGCEREQAGWAYRVIEQEGELVLQVREAGAWSDLYAMLARPVPRIDVETVNWWTSTNPRSPFVTGLVAAASAPDGTRTMLSDWDGLTLTTRTPHGSEVTPLRRAEVPELLDSRFGLRGFELGADGRVVRAQSSGVV